MLQSPDVLAAKDVIEAAFKSLAAVGAVFAAIGSITAFFLTRRWHVRDRELASREAALVRQQSEAARQQELAAAERSKRRDVLYESLKWFEGGTQKRSIGIAVVGSSWEPWPEFRGLWIELLANQAIYLLIASEQGRKPHEHDNLRRIMEILVRERSLITQSTAALLVAAMDDKAAGSEREGLTRTPQLRERLVAWREELTATNAK